MKTDRTTDNTWMMIPKDAKAIRTHTT